MNDAGTQLVQAFRQEVRNTPQRLLMLDYDGTLAPFTPDRERAIPYPCVRELLPALLRKSTLRVVIVSGREVAVLERLLGMEQLPELWGSHGWERRFPDGRLLPPELEASVASGLREEWQWLRQHFPASACEQKPASVALHWRGRDAAEASAFRDTAQGRWRARYDGRMLDVHLFDGGVELRAAGRSKGDAVRTLLDEVSRPVAAAFLGDDLTDEDAFRALGTRGLSVLVRNEFRPTAASLHLRPPDDLCTFLNMFIEEVPDDGTA